MTGMAVRAAEPSDFPAITHVLQAAFGGTDEAELVHRLRDDNDVVLELVAEADAIVIGHILFSRLKVAVEFNAVALAPLAVLPSHQGKGAGGELVRAAHKKLAACGETLLVVLGDPEYYARFGYQHRRAAGFDSQYQGKYLQALAFAEAPTSGQLIYAPAFGAL